MNQPASKTIGEKSHSRGRFAVGKPGGRRAGEQPATLADAFRYAAILDDFEEFEPIYRQTLSVFERVYGSELLEIAVNLNHRDAVRRTRAEAVASEAAHRRVLAMRERRCGAEHSHRVLTAMNHALLLFELGRLEGERRLAAHASVQRRSVHLRAEAPRAAVSGKNTGAVC
jgi:hypothetical protein